MNNKSKRKAKCFIFVSGILCLTSLYLYYTDEPQVEVIEVQEKPRRVEIVYDLSHFDNSKSLDHYVNNIELLLEPSSCSKMKHLVAMVSSRPSSVMEREAIRNTWGRKLPPYFLLGVEGYFEKGDKLGPELYEEAAKNNDLIMYSVWEHYQNLTLKTMLMLNWTISHCPNVKFFFKTDDDILVNPWVLLKVVDDHINDQLIGFKKRDSVLHSKESNKWFVPVWMQSVRHISEYLMGAGYIINGKYLKRIYEKARSVPLINLEDVYLTHFVAKHGLGLKLTHDERMNARVNYKDAYAENWTGAITHEFKPKQMYEAWKLLVNRTKI